MWVWKCLGDIELEFLTKVYNQTMGNGRMPEEWRNCVMIGLHIFKSKGEVYISSN